MSNQFNLFGEDISEEIKQEELKRKYSERAKKAAETRKRKKKEKEELFDKMLTIARCPVDLFGNAYSKEEVEEAERYIQEEYRKRNDS